VRVGPPPEGPAEILGRLLRLVCALVLGTTLVTLGVGAEPAAAATPVGGPSTPGIWGTHTVTFVSLGRTLSTVQVADGGHAPRQPAPPAADGVFSGWFTSAGGVDVPFDFDTTVVESDLTVRAHFTTTHIVQFLAPAMPGQRTRVLDSDEIADGAPMGDIAPDVPDTPGGSVFTGQWAVRGDASQTPYDFTRPVTTNLVLVPILADGFAVSFVTDGTSIEPVFVLEPDTEFTQADLDAVPTPTRVGYTFTGWYANASGTQPVVLPLTSTTTLYAGWQGDNVEYHVSYWLEKADIVPASYPTPEWTPAGGTLPAWGAGDGALSTAQLHDRANFDFLADLPDTATAGTTVSGPTTTGAIPTAVQTLVKAQLDPTGVQSDPMTFAGIGLSEANVTVLGNGSTVVNVYLTRTLWRNDYPVIAPGTNSAASQRCSAAQTYDITMTVGGKVYYRSAAPVAGNGALLGTYSVRTKVGFDMGAIDVAPVSLDQSDGTPQITGYDAGTQDQSCVLRGWGPLQTTPSVFQPNYTGANADSGGVSLSARTTAMSSVWSLRSTQNATEGFLYVEAEDQAQSAPDDVLSAAGTPNDPVHVETLYNNNKTTVRAAIPTGHQVFEQYRSSWYWATNGDRQIASIIDGFTSYVGYGTGANTQGNGFQLDQPTNRLYQLNNSGNVNDRYRYHFYSRNAYDLVFVTGGGSTIAPVTGIRYQSALAPYTPTAPTRGRDVFQGWYTDSSFNTPFVFSQATMPPSNLVLYAKWLVDPHTVTFYDDPSSTSPISSYTQLVEDQGQATQPAPLAPRPDGSTFLGWYQRTSAGYFVPYDFDTPVGSDLKLYARWQQPASSPYDVLYDGNGKTGGTVPVDTWTYNAGASAIVADGSSLVRGRQVFVGWRLRVGTSSARIAATPTAGPIEGLYQAGHTVPLGGRDITLVAVYADPHPVRIITFVENGGRDRRVTWSGAPGASVTYPGAHDVSFTGPGGGRRFLGWSTNPSAKRPDPAYKRLTVSHLTGGLVLYAIWSKVTTGGGDVGNSSDSHNPGSGGLPGLGGPPFGVLGLALAMLGLGTALTVRARRHST
jgi:uncharacterized repeat protein (TIGR02543 family)